MSLWQRQEIQEMLRLCSALIFVHQSNDRGEGYHPTADFDYALGVWIGV